MILQPIIDVAEICARKGIRDAILSPGSRCAPLTIGFAKHQNISAKTVSDERSAGFIALGIAQESKNPVALICTSGTAVLNYGPAIAEAYFNHVPLLVITADRPPQWINQNDGQTIYQENVYGKHVKGFFSLLSEYRTQDSVDKVTDIVSQAYNLCASYPTGPVHINVPIDEPFYPTREEKITFSTGLKITNHPKKHKAYQRSIPSKFTNALKLYERILIVGGQDYLSQELLEKFSLPEYSNIPIIGDIITNLHPLDKVIRHPDLYLARLEDNILEQLKPDLLITFGRSIISKNLKLYLRKFKASAHWHIQPNGHVPDAYRSITYNIKMYPDSFFSELSGYLLNNNQSYFNKWCEIENKAKGILNEFLKSGQWGELKAVKVIMKSLPLDSHLHLANSMPVRLANFIGLQAVQGDIEVFANRGTSGIDGTNGSAMGASMATDKPVVLLTGDMAFLYDRNAFWHNYPQSNFRVIVLNNHGGGIFGMIDGPANQEEFEEYFLTNQPLTARKTAEEFGLGYTLVENEDQLNNEIGGFFSESQVPKILEIITDNSVNQAIFKRLKSIKF